MLDNGTDFGIDINNTHAFLLVWSTLKGLTIWSPSASSDETISEALLSVRRQNWPIFDKKVSKGKKHLVLIFEKCLILSDEVG